MRHIHFITITGRDVGAAVIVHAFYFEDLSLNPGADLIEIVMVLGRANQSTLFQHSIATILKKLFMI